LAPNPINTGNISAPVTTAVTTRKLIVTRRTTPFERSAITTV
jgi:hypothetical protein